MLPGERAEELLLGVRWRLGGGRGFYHPCALRTSVDVVQVHGSGRRIESTEHLSMYTP